MSYTKQDLELMIAVCNEDRDAFISAFTAGASLVSSANGKSRFSTNPKIQAMIEFGLALDHKQIPRTDTAALLEWDLSKVTLETLPALIANHADIIKILANGKDKLLGRVSSTSRLL